MLFQKFECTANGEGGFPEILQAFKECTGSVHTSPEEAHHNQSFPCDRCAIIRIAHNLADNIVVPFQLLQMFTEKGILLKRRDIFHQENGDKIIIRVI